MKKIIAIVLVLALVLSITACGSDNSEPTATVTPVVTAAPATTSPTVAPEAEDPEVEATEAPEETSAVWVSLSPTSSNSGSSSTDDSTAIELSDSSSAVVVDDGDYIIKLSDSTSDYSITGDTYGDIEITGNTAGTITINTPNAHVDFYGVAGDVEAITADSTFNVIGKITGTLTVNGGKVSVDSDAVVNKLEVPESSTTKEVEIAGKVDQAEIASPEVETVTISSKGSADDSSTALKIASTASSTVVEVTGGSTEIANNSASTIVKATSGTTTIDTENSSEDTYVDKGGDATVLVADSTDNAKTAVMSSDSAVISSTASVEGTGDEAALSQNSVIEVTASAVENTDDLDADYVVPYGSTLTVNEDTNSYAITNYGTIVLSDTYTYAGTITNNGTMQVYGATSIAKAALIGGTVKLMDDITADVTVGSSIVMTLDLNGKTLTNYSSHTITNAGKLTINDSVGGGIVDNTIHAKAAIYNTGTATLNNGTFKRSLETGVDITNNTTSGTDANSYYTVYNYGGTLTIDGATVENDGGYSSNIGNTNKGSITINSGTITGGANAVKSDEDCTLIINGGTFENSMRSAVLSWGTTTINGGKFTLIDSELAPETAAVIVNGYYSVASSITINGGEFIGSLVYSQYAGYTASTLLTINSDVTLNEGQTIEVLSNSMLTIADGATLTNNGTIYAKGNYDGASYNTAGVLIEDGGTFVNNGVLDAYMGNFRIFGYLENNDDIYFEGSTLQSLGYIVNKGDINLKAIIMENGYSECYFSSMGTFVDTGSVTTDAYSMLSILAVGQSEAESFMAKFKDIDGMLTIMMIESGCVLLDEYEDFDFTNAVVDVEITSNLTIPSGVGIVVIGDLTIKSGVTLTLSAGSVLSVWGDVINYGTVILSDGTYKDTNVTDSSDNEVSYEVEDNCARLMVEGELINNNVLTIGQNAVVEVDDGLTNNKTITLSDGYYTEEYEYDSESGNWTKTYYNTGARLETWGFTNADGATLTVGKGASVFVYENDNGTDDTYDDYAFINNGEVSLRAGDYNLEGDDSGEYSAYVESAYMYVNYGVNNGTITVDETASFVSISDFDENGDNDNGIFNGEVSPAYS